jgi:hypothetical protein
MTNVTRVLIAATAALVSLPLPKMSAQGSATLRALEGKKVRLNVSITDEGEHTGAVVIRGTVFEVSRDSIHVLQDGGLVSRIPLSGILSLSVRSGRNHRQGAINGALIGAGFGLFVTFMEPIDCDGRGRGFDCRDDGSSPSTTQYVQENVAASVFLGVLIGGVVGTERWEEVITRQRITVGSARGGGIRLGLSFER